MKTKLIFTFYILLFIQLSSYAQLSADFTANKTQGCGVLGSVSFTDLSSGNPTSWLWDFGNSNTSTLQNPTVNYSSTGFYTVKLTVSDGTTSKQITKTNYIKVFKKPQSNFTASPLSGCNPLLVNFTDQSTSVDGTINQWLWDFNDGSPANTNANPSHQYVTTGLYSVSLKVTDDNGCTDTKIQNNLIDVFNSPIANFRTLVPAVSCIAPYTVNFINNSTGSNLTYKWDFGDGQNSTLAAPSHTYTSNGKYTVQLIVTDVSGCKDTLTLVDYVIIEPISSAFTQDNDSVCTGAIIKFTNNSTAATNYLWDFGDGTTTFTKSPFKKFPKAGTFSIRLISKNGSNCADTSYSTVYVDSIKADFTSQPLIVCQTDTVIFVNTSFNANSINWRVGNDTSKHYSDTVRYTPFLNNLNPSDTLIAISALGCRDTIIKHNRKVFFTLLDPKVNPDGGCIPQFFTLDAQSISLSPIVSYNWQIGQNGVLGTSTNKITNYTISRDTTIKASITIVDSLGCTATDTVIFAAGDTIPNSHILLNDTICGNDSIVFITDIDGRKASIKSIVDLTNNKVLSFTKVMGPADTDTIKIYNFVDTGYTDIRVTLTNKSCDFGYQIEAYIYGPIINTIIDSIACPNLAKHYFSAEIIDYDRFYWDFGDFSPIDSVNINPIHTYTNNGSYDVTLTVYNDSTNCFYKATQETFYDTIVTKIYLSVDSNCIPFSYKATPQFNLLPQSYYWNVNGVDLMQDSIVDTMNYRGAKEIQLIYVDYYGCLDTIKNYVYGFKPIPAFTSDKQGDCKPFTVQFLDSSQGQGILEKWEWRFGNSLGDTIQNPTSFYSIEGAYDVFLKVTDSLGCTDSILKTEYINYYFNLPRFLSSKRNVCVGDTVYLNNISVGDSLRYKWYFGNGDSSTVKNPKIVFNNPGSYDIQLISTDPNNCDKIENKLAYITVLANPIADFIADTTQANCYPLPVNFTDLSTGLNINKWNWKFGDNSQGSVFQNPFHNYTSIGKFDVKLVVSNQNGCKDSIIKPQYIETRGPSAKIRFFPDSICVNESITFEMINPENVFSFYWDFADGKIDSVSPVSHRYTNRAGTLYPTLVLSDSSNQCSVGIRDTIYIQEVLSQIDISDSAGCEPLTVNINSNNSLGLNSFSWDLGDGNSSTQINLTKTYNAGIYPIRLIGEGMGCFDTAYVDLKVYANPIAQIIPDSSICEGDSIQLFSSGGINYLWSPIDGLSQSTISNPKASPSQTTNYLVQVIDSNNCSDTASMNLIVQKEAKIILNMDTLLYLGESMNLVKFNNAQHYNYTWKPPLGLNYTDCKNPLAMPLVNTMYYLTATDSFGCFTFTDSIFIEVFDGFTIDIPTAFSPNGDGSNDIIYVRGWGIKELLVFEIYNRWGEKVFESTDLKKGWDGTYKGKDQAMDTYVYVVKAMSFQNKLVEKKGNITLLR